jgi:hypothetical protein
VLDEAGNLYVNSELEIVKLDRAGQLDSSFGSGGRVRIDGGSSSSTCRASSRATRRATYTSRVQGRALPTPPRSSSSIATVAFNTSGAVRNIGMDDDGRLYIGISTSTGCPGSDGAPGFAVYRIAG